MDAGIEQGRFEAIVWLQWRLVHARSRWDVWTLTSTQSVGRIFSIETGDLREILYGQGSTGVAGRCASLEPHSRKNVALSACLIYSETVRPMHQRSRRAADKDVQQVSFRDEVVPPNLRQHSDMGDQ